MPIYDQAGHDPKSRRLKEIITEMIAAETWVGQRHWADKWYDWRGQITDDPEPARLRLPLSHQQALWRLLGQAGEKTPEPPVFSLSWEINSQNPQLCQMVWNSALISIMEMLIPDRGLLPQLEEALTGGGALAKHTACRMLANLGPESWAAWPAMRDCLAHDANGLWLSGVINQALSADPGRLSQIHDAFNDFNLTGKLTVLGLLSRLPEQARAWPWPEALRQAILECLKNGAEKIQPGQDELEQQSLAYQVLKNMPWLYGETGEVIRLIKLGLISPAWHVRANAAKAAAGFRRAAWELLPPLLDLLNDWEGQEFSPAQCALETLAEFGPAALTALPELKRLVGELTLKDQEKDLFCKTIKAVSS